MINVSCFLFSINGVFRWSISMEHSDSYNILGKPSGKAERTTLIFNYLPLVTDRWF